MCHHTNTSGRFGSFIDSQVDCSIPQVRRRLATIVLIMLNIIPVTFGFVLIRAMNPIKGGLLAVAQIAGGITASGIAEAILPGKLQVGTSLGGYYSHFFFL
jgi:hypothetical protein